MPPMLDVTGEQYGRLTVLTCQMDRRPSRSNSGATRLFAICHCRCGTLAYLPVNKIRSGHTSSCGCLAREAAARLNRQHGGSHSRLHAIWKHMRQRCTNPKDQDWQWYGAKGVKVCPEWDDFDAFRSWALASGYADDLTIDRIDSDSDYEPGNCQWVTAGENSRRANLKRWHG